MKSLLILLTFTLSLPLFAEDEERINLSASAAKNLRIQLAESEDITFESTLFTLGHLQEIPSNHAIVSSRIPGHITQLSVIAGDFVKKGDPILKIQSRQTGNPPPTITLYAPATGIIAQSHIRLGEPVDPSKELLHILDLRQIWAIARIPQQEAGKLKIGTKARIKIAAHQNKTIPGQLIRFGTTADPTSGTLDAIFLIDNPENTLRPGMRAEFSIITSTRPDITAVPRKAVQGDITNRVVYVKDFDLPNSFIKAPVITGEENDQYIEIKEGLFPGDEVVTTGSYLLGFAGGGNLSLKEVLDAAHGHEHNEDGSEITNDQKPTPQDHHNHASHSPTNKLLILTNLILLILLILAGIKLAKKQ